MTQAERLARTDECDRFSDWLTVNDPQNFVQYHYARTAALDAMAAPIMPGETLQVTVGDQTYEVSVVRAL